MSYDIIDFKKEAIEESYRQPVLVDFWAPWCGPCRFLGPILEKLAEKNEGKWVLKKLNVDENQDIAAAYNVVGIPAVKLFRNGVPVAEFTGALPEFQVEKWLKDNIPSENDEKAEQAVRLIEEGATDKAMKILSGIIEEEPDHSKAAFHLGKLILFDDPEKAEKLFKTAEKDPAFIDQTGYIKKIVSLLEMRAHPEKLAEHPVKSVLLEGLEALSRKDFAQAVDRFIQVVMRNKSYENELAREAAVAVFNYLGPAHEVSKNYRRRFDMALY